MHALLGLLHDIGHGPFSHSYETFVLVDFPIYYQRNAKVQSLYNDSGWPEVPKDWTHESASLLMIDAALAYLGLAIDVHNLNQPLKQIGNGIDARSMRAKASNISTENDDNDSTILTNRDWIFVKECIWGKPIPDIEKIYGPGFHGRTGEHQDWLYDIVANRHSGLDVDKVDYYARDRRRALREAGEIDKLMIEEAIVAWAPCTDPKGCHRCKCHSKSTVDKGEMLRNKHLMICYPDKMVGASMNFFKTRFELHSIIYKHKTNVGVAHMISDILCLADPHFLISIAPFSGPNGSHSIGIPKTEYEFLPLSRAMLHPMSYLRLRDSVIDQIEATTCPELEPARKLVHRLWSRDLYKCVATKVLKVQKVPKDRRIWELSSSGIVKDIVDLNAQHDDGNGGIIQLIEYDVIVDKCQIHHGQKHLDPLAKMRFVEKSQLNKLSTSNYKDLPEAKIVSDDEYDSYLPRTLMECSLRIYCRDTKKVDLLRHAFELWWDSIHDEMEITIEPNRNANRQPRENIAILSQETDDEDDNDNEIYNDDAVGMESINHFGNDGSFPPWCSPN
jgi:deoxynucleoside triphosphate triphosphohydrolase SAMHD1